MKKNRESFSNPGSKIFTVDDVYNIPINPIPLSKKWRDILGNIPLEEQWTMMIFGYSQSGKSSMGLKVAQTISPFGDVLYNAAEEKVSTGTIALRCQRMQVASDNISIFQNRKISELRSALDHNTFKYCVIDSCNRMSLTQPELLEIFNLQEEYPDTSFVFIAHGNKEMKNYIGPAALQNMVDISIEMNKGDIIIVKNYFSIEGNKKTNYNIFKDKL